MFQIRYKLWRSHYFPNGYLKKSQASISSFPGFVRNPAQGFETLCGNPHSSAKNPVSHGIAALPATAGQERR
jgi:hypothetical protein